MNAIAERKMRFQETYLLFGAEDDFLLKMLENINKNHTNAQARTDNAAGETIVELLAIDDNHLGLIRKELLSQCKEQILAGPNLTLEEAFFRALMSRGLSVATAESVTGGLIASRILDQPGASRILKESYIVYADEAKRKILNIEDKFLKKHGSVSENTVREMATKLKLISQSDVIIATTGYAGPTGGTAKDPVGTVYYGIDIENRLVTIRKQFSGSRADVRKKACAFAMAYVVDKLKTQRGVIQDE